MGLTGPTGHMRLGRNRWLQTATSYRHLWRVPALEFSEEPYLLGSQFLQPCGNHHLEHETDQSCQDPDGDRGGKFSP